MNEFESSIAEHFGDIKEQCRNINKLAIKSEIVRAAGPELLEACKAIVAYDESEKESDFVLMMVLYNEAITKARAAIEKAEGNV